MFVKKILLPVTIAALSHHGSFNLAAMRLLEGTVPPLFTNALQVTKDNYLGENNLGTDLFKRGKDRRGYLSLQ